MFKRLSDAHKKKKAKKRIFTFSLGNYQAFWYTGDSTYTFDFFILLIKNPLGQAPLFRWRSLPKAYFLFSICYYILVKHYRI